MKNQECTVSYIVTVFNKEPYISNTVKSLLDQTCPFPVEYIFVDDVSSDASVQVIEKLTHGMDNVTIVKNTVNRGPSVRLNQGARIARGQYLQFFDSDDIMAANTTEVMHRLLKQHDADLIYGKWQRVDMEGVDILGRKIPESPPHRVSDMPLETVLKGSFVRMTLMVRRDVFLRAGGADETVFIQDESLALRLAAVSRRFIAMDAPVMFVPRLEGVLSGNKSQLNHDRFLAHYHMLIENKATLPLKERKLLYNACLSAAWKQNRQEKKLRAHFTPLFRTYVMSKLGLGTMDMDYLSRLAASFGRIDGVRRIDYVPEPRIHVAAG